MLLRMRVRLLNPGEGRWIIRMLEKGFSFSCLWNEELRCMREDVAREILPKLEMTMFYVFRNHISIHRGGWE
jgi:hypothetical protein